MKRKMIILRARGLDRGAASDRSALQLEHDELGLQELARTVAHPEVKAVAPAMPMKLIEPVARSDAAEPAHDAIAWGVRAVGADQSPYSGAGVVVAVLDTGIDERHPAFAGVELVQRDFTGEGTEDALGHGTHCAGTIFGRAVDGARIGVAPGIQKALIGKVLGQRNNDSSQIASAIMWAFQSGAQIASMSLGIDFPGLVKLLTDAGWPIEAATSRALEDYRANVALFARLAALVQLPTFGAGMLLIAAAGNENQRGGDKRFVIAVSPPAVADGIISVAAVARGADGLTPAPFSNTGANVAAPGVDSQSAKVGGGLSSMSGTSMATPHVAGVAALWAESMRSAGSITSSTLSARLTGSGVYTALAQPFDAVDVGTGVVCAPGRSEDRP
jgi:subtilisin family serine protease